MTTHPLAQRLDHRHTLVLDTEIRMHLERDNVVLRCQTGNIGLNGAYLNTPGLPMHEHDKLDLVLRAECRDQVREVRLCGQVAWTSGQGIGIRFECTPECNERTLRKFLMEAKFVAHAKKRGRS